MSDCSTNAFKVPGMYTLEEASKRAKAVSKAFKEATENTDKQICFEQAVINHLYYMQSEMESMADRMDDLERRMADTEKKRRKQSKYFSTRILECHKAVNQCQRNKN